MNLVKVVNLKLQTAIYFYRYMSSFMRRESSLNIGLEQIIIEGKLLLNNSIKTST